MITSRPSLQLWLIPRPQKIQIGQGGFSLPPAGVIGITDFSLYAIARQMEQSLFNGYAINISHEGLNDTVSLCLVKGMKPDGYRLTIGKPGLRVEGSSCGAVFYGLQTLRQIAEQSPVGRLPVLTIDDWPDLADRGLYYDVSRGRVPKLEQLKQMVDTLAQYKINQFQLYQKHTFAYRGHPDIGKDASPLTAEDILELDAFCRERYVELVPSLPSFGHLETVLKHPRYHHLAEDWGKGKYVTPDTKAQEWLKRWYKTPFSLAPANPESYKFLDSLYAEFLPLFSSKRFHVCCDETVDLGYGQSYALAQKLGRGRLYLRHIMTLHELSGKYGKKIMFWGDIIRHYPELIADIPKDVTVLDWNYEHDHDFESIRDFQKAGLSFYACPSTGSYGSLFPCLPKAMANIAGFAAAAFKYGGQGLLNTEWGDGGHFNLTEYSWHGFLFGAEQGWNTRSDQSDFTSRFCRRFLKTDAPEMAQAMTDLGSEINYPYNMWSNIYFANADKPMFPLGTRGALSAVDGKFSSHSITFDAAFGRQTIRRLDRIRTVFIAHSARRGEDPLKVLPYWVFAVDALKHAAKKVVLMGAKGNNTATARRKLADEMEALKKRFQELWLARNRVGEIKITLEAYRKAIQAVRQNRLAIKPPPGCSPRILLSQTMPDAGKMHSLPYPVNRDKLHFKVREFGSSIIEGCVLYDLHHDVFYQPAHEVLVYFACPFNCPRPMKLNVCLGYDGPVKAWIDGAMVFHDPEGTNPANPDKALIPFDAAAGAHEVVIALGSNQGKAWGLFLQFKRRDLTPAQIKSGKTGDLPSFAL